MYTYKHNVKGLMADGIPKRSLLLRIIFLTSLLLAPNLCSSQNNDFEAASYNIISGMVIGGVGAVINKRKDEKVSKAALRGLIQGAVGGYVVFESKKMVRHYYRKGNTGTLWPSKILNELGNSVILNGASNRNFGETWQFNLGFSSFHYDMNRQNRFRVRIMPFSLSSTAYGFIVGKLDVKNSLRYANFVFKRKKPLPWENGYGFALVNTIVYRDHPTVLAVLDDVLSHEYIHTLQYTGHSGMNAFVVPVVKGKFPHWYNKVFYTDFNTISYGAIDLGFDLLIKIRQDRPYEKEAYYYVPKFF